MHDGRFYTLQGVLTHYTSGVMDMPALDPLLKAGGKTGIALTAREQEQLLAFLNTLNDKKFITDTRFSQETQ
jgi:cytochrome c peroxidase